MTSRDNSKWEEVTFTVHCTMRRRWASQFLGMLERMQLLGSVGASRPLTFLSDGDGDYRPTFIIDGDVPTAAQGITDNDVSETADEFSKHNCFDAG